MTRMIYLSMLAFAIAAPAVAQSPAARVGDSTNHGGTIIGPGVATVQIEGETAAVKDDQTTCPLFDGTVPHIGGPIISGSATVLIGGKPAARVGDINAENGSSATIVTGALTVNIGP